MSKLEEKISALPPDLQREVGDFIDFLLEKRQKRPSKKPTFIWAGTLRDLTCSSVELQHQASAWRLGEK